LLLSLASLLFAGSYGMQVAIEVRGFHGSPDPTFHWLLGWMLMQTWGAVVVAIGLLAMVIARGWLDRSPSAVEEVAQVPDQVH
jgi:hypothetical protein